MSKAIYRGRFAPSPTGPLHFGSLVAALGSWLEARTHEGEWLLRIEDLDRPREQPGAVAAILKTLEACGLEWDGEPVFQSRRTARYALALKRLESLGSVFPCACSRREIADSTLQAGDEAVYPGTCRKGMPTGRSARSLRACVTDSVIAFDDRVQGRISQSLARDVGDFVIKRAGGFFAYQLAVVVDDGEQGITHVVRGADLLDSTPRQIYLQQLLDYPAPQYAHLPVAVTPTGEKLSKQTLATPIDLERIPVTLMSALAFLGQQVPKALGFATSSEILAWARAHWQLAKVQKSRTGEIPNSADFLPP